MKQFPILCLGALGCVGAPLLLTGCGSSPEKSAHNSTAASSSAAPAATSTAPAGTNAEAAPKTVPKKLTAPAPTEAPKRSFTGARVKPPTDLGNAQGRVLYNGQGAPNIEVSLCQKISSQGGCSGKTFRSKTDENGNYTIDKVKPGEYSLAVRVFDTKSFIYPTSGLFSAAKYKVEAGQTLDIRATTLFKTNLQTVSPQSGETIKTGAPKLSWKAFPDAANYQLTLRAKAATLESSTLKTASTFVTPKTPLLNGSYQWKVEATNAKGTKIAETPGFLEFKVAGQAGSTAVSLITPAANATVAGAKLKLTWKSHPLATGYQIYLSPVSGGLPVLAYQDVTGTQYTLDKPLVAGQYFWTVLALRNGKKVAASPLLSFKVK